MISVAVAGYAGRMGSAVVDAVTAAKDMGVVCGIDPLVEKHLLLPIKALMTHFRVHPLMF